MHIIVKGVSDIYFSIIDPVQYAKKRDGHVCDQHDKGLHLLCNTYKLDVTLLFI